MTGNPLALYAVPEAHRCYAGELGASHPKRAVTFGLLPTTGVLLLGLTPPPHRVGPWLYLPLCPLHALVLAELETEDDPVTWEFPVIATAVSGRYLWPGPPP